MKRSFNLFSRVFLRSITPQRISKHWLNLAKGALLAGIYHQYTNFTQTQAECSIFASNKFNYHTAAKSNIVIYRHNKDEPVAAGIIIDENGLCISISNIYPRISEDKLDMNSFYAKVLGDEHTYALNFIEYLTDDNIVIFKLVRRDPDIRFQPAKFTHENSLGSTVYAIGKSHLDFNLMESGLINETNFNAKAAFGKENDTNSFNIMTNIPNRNTTLFGGPLYDENGNVLGMILPYDDKLLPTHTLATPYSFLEGIIKQYKENNRVRRPYLGMSIKSSGSGNGAFVIKISSDSPAHQVGIKLGDTIVEINDQRITNNNDFFKCLGYNIGQDLKLKLERDGKYRIVHIKSS